MSFLDTVKEKLSKVDVEKTVTSATQTLSSNVNKLLTLAGGIFKEYNIGEQVASGGPAMSWRIYDAVKKSTKQQVSLFVYDKDQISHFSKQDRTESLALAKQGWQKQLRIIHPLVLRVTRGMEETREHLIVETERVSCSLANMLRDYRTLPRISSSLSTEWIDSLGIKVGALQLAECLSFLHDSASLSFSDINPQNIFIAADGKWKLCCFYHTHSFRESASVPYSWNDEEQLALSPCLDYCAPEFVLAKSCLPASDVYSLGCLLWELHHTEQKCKEVALKAEIHPSPGSKISTSVKKFSDGSESKTTFFENNSNYQPIKGRLIQSENSPTKYKKALERLNPLPLDAIPFEFRDTIGSLLSIDPNQRMSLKNFIGSSYFLQDTMLQTVIFLNDIIAKDESTKLSFLKGLSRIISQFNPSTLTKTILPSLIPLLNDETLVVPIIEVIIQIAKVQSKEDFCKTTLPIVGPYLKKDDPKEQTPQTLRLNAALLSGIETFAARMDSASINAYITKLLERSLKINDVAVISAALSALPTVATSLDSSSVKNVILPRVLDVGKRSTKSKLRVLALRVLATLAKSLDSVFVRDVLLHDLQTIVNADGSASVVMGVVGVCAELSVSLGGDATARCILPLVAPLLVAQTLSQKQFTLCYTEFQKMLKSVETSRIKKYGAEAKPSSEPDLGFDTLLQPNKQSVTLQQSENIQQQQQLPFSTQSLAGSNASKSDLAAFNQLIAKQNQTDVKKSSNTDVFSSNLSGTSSPFSSSGASLSGSGIGSMSSSSTSSALRGISSDPFASLTSGAASSASTSPFTSSTKPSNSFASDPFASLSSSKPSQANDNAFSFISSQSTQVTQQSNGLSLLSPQQPQPTETKRKYELPAELRTTSQQQPSSDIFGIGISATTPSSSAFDFNSTNSNMAQSFTPPSFSKQQTKPQQQFSSQMSSGNQFSSFGQPQTANTDLFGGLTTVSNPSSDNPFNIL